MAASEFNLRFESDELRRLVRQSTGRYQEVTGETHSMNKEIQRLLWIALGVPEPAPIQKEERREPEAIPASMSGV